MPTFEDLKTEDKWVHEHAYIFPNGKIIDPVNENQIERNKTVASDEGIIIV